jgi:Immunity protein family (Imm11)
MKIYEPLRAGPYEFCHPINEDEFETVAELCNGTPRAASWKPLKMRLVREDEGEILSASDSPWLASHVMILRARAAAALSPLLLEDGELLPLECPGAELWLYNVTRVTDALDEAASTIDRFRDGRIMLVRRPVFYGDRIEGIDAFKLSHDRGEPIYVSQRLVDHWHAAKLTGIEFLPVWSG